MALLTWTFAHGDLTHYLSNVVVILLVGPLIEDRYGSLRMLGILAAASVIVGLAQCVTDPGGALIGASGTVFCLIMMTATLAGRTGAIPVTVLLVADCISAARSSGCSASTAFPRRPTSWEDCWECFSAS
jgi:rhomboid protease GluP